MADKSYLLGLPKEARYEGRHERGEIEIVTDPAETKRIAFSRHELISGVALEQTSLDIGVVFRDEYITVVRDPVRFPNGKTGTYLRIIERADDVGPVGVVMVPVRAGLVYLNEIFRHATRSWEVECPRGYREKGYTPEEAARKEIREELGFDTIEVVKLGTIKPNTGLLASVVEVFLVRLAPGTPVPSPESGEAFGSTIALTVAELYELIGAGKLQDGFTLAALALSITRGFL